MSLWLMLWGLAWAQDPTGPEEGGASETAAEELDRDGDLFERMGQAPSDEAGAGRGLLVAYGGFAGHYLGASLGSMLNGYSLDENTGAGILVGVGGTLGANYYFKNRDYTRDQAALIWGGGAWGTWTGYQLARLIISKDGQYAEERTAAAGALSCVGATGLAVLFRTRAPDLAVSGLVLGAGAFGWQVGGGFANLMELDRSDDRRLVASLELAGSYAYGLGAWVLAETGRPIPTPQLSAFYVAQGAFVGAWVPYLFDETPIVDHMVGSVRIGTGLGAAAAMALTPWGIGQHRRIAGQSAGFGIGGLIGFGTSSLFLDYPTHRSQAAGVLVGSLGGELVGAWLAPRWQADKTSLLLVGGLETWSLYQAVGWSIWADMASKGGHTEMGLFSVSLGLGSALAWTLPALVDLQPTHTVTPLSTGAWGSAYGNWVSFLLETSPEDNLRNMLIAGEVGLVAGLAGSLVRPLDPRQVALVDGMGLGGAVVGGLVGIAIDGEPRTATLATTIGATVGLAGGTTLVLLRPDLFAGEPALALNGPRRPRWLPDRSPVIPSVLATPWFDEEGGTGAMVQLTLTERE